MAGETFVDTSGFYAALVKKDDRHDEAAEYLRRARDAKASFVTTDYVLDETVTLLKARGLAGLTRGIFDIVEASRVCRLRWTDAELFWTSRAYFLRHLDQSWSFTDCVSFCVMRELHLMQALTKDDHFREAGYEPLLA